MAFSDGSSLVFTVWTDWAIRVEERNGVDLPEYLWPTSEKAVEPIPGLGESPVTVFDVRTQVNEVGDLIGVDLVLDSAETIEIRSISGEMVLEVARESYGSSSG